MKNPAEIFGKHCFTVSSTVLENRTIENLLVEKKCVLPTTTFLEKDSNSCD